jgi:hypothetical protein
MTIVTVKTIEAKSAKIVSMTSSKPCNQFSGSSNGKAKVILMDKRKSKAQ